MPSAGIIDSQSVKGADTVGRDRRGDDAGKKISGRKRFIVTLGLLLTVAACAGRLVGSAAADTLHTKVAIVRKPTGQNGFAVLPRRSTVERTLAWLTAHRRPARD